MIIVSGFIEVNNKDSIYSVIEALKKRNVEIHGVNEEKIVFLIERDFVGVGDIERRIRKELDSLKEIDGINNVYLAYFCLDDREG
ncbi:MAG: chaperone NapD [Thermodesulfovibrionales bacterium]|nr:chaperone NapD [Thermodesulfovibrionales bacterium]